MPQIGEKYEKNGITIEVHYLSESQVYCGRWNVKDNGDLVRVTFAEFEKQIQGAKKL